MARPGTLAAAAAAAVGVLVGSLVLAAPMVSAQYSYPYPGHSYAACTLNMALGGKCPPQWFQPLLNVKQSAPSPSAPAPTTFGVAANAPNVACPTSLAGVGSAIPDYNLTQANLFRPACPNFPDSSTVWKYWSDPASWPSGAVPVANDDVVIPCGTFMYLDVSPPPLHSLWINGTLKFLDSPSTGSINLTSIIIINMGLVQIGEADNHFGSATGNKAIIYLINTANGRPPFQGPSDGWGASYAGALAYQNRLFPGQAKAFITVGGRLDLHGLRAGSSMPTWTRLAATARRGDTSLLLSDPTGAIAASWRAGDLIGIAPTDYDYLEAESLTITGVAPGADGVTTLVSLSKALVNQHWGGGMTTYGVSVPEYAGEVVLLTRNIFITAPQEPNVTKLYCQLNGGHFVVFQTLSDGTNPQQIEGVEVVGMGQQGNIGKYPLHLHMNLDMSGSYLRKNSVHHSFQRCYVMHAVWNLVVDNNVAFDNYGHCYFFEDGIESGITMTNNVGILQRQLPPGVKNILRTEDTDDVPTIVWITNINNTYINNVAAGCQDTGIWIELRNFIRGGAAALNLTLNGIPWQECRTITPGIYNCLKPDYGLGNQIVDRNVAHSSTDGFRNYPRPYRAYFNGENWNLRNVDNGGWNLAALVMRNTRLTVYKSLRRAYNNHKHYYMILEGAKLLDAQVCVNLDTSGGVVIKDLDCIAQSRDDSTGLAINDPYGCANACIQSAAIPTACKWGTNKYIGGGGGSQPLSNYQYGLVYFPDEWNDLLPGIEVTNVRFYGFGKNKCFLRDATAGSATRGQGSFALAIDSTQAGGNSLPNFDSRNSIEKATFFDTPVTARFLFGGGGQGLAVQYQSTLLDKDGSVIGVVDPAFANGGYLLPPNNPGLLPPSRVGYCVNYSPWNATICTAQVGQKLCYRTIGLHFYDWNCWSDPKKPGNDYNSCGASNKATFLQLSTPTGFTTAMRTNLAGNSFLGETDARGRAVSFNGVSGETYSVGFSGPVATNITWLSMEVGDDDPVNPNGLLKYPNCGGYISVLVPPTSDGMVWQFSAGSAFPVPCPGSPISEALGTDYGAAGFAGYETTCVNGVRTTRAWLGTQLIGLSNLNTVLEGGLLASRVGTGWVPAISGWLNFTKVAGSTTCPSISTCAPFHPGSGWNLGTEPPTPRSLWKYLDDGVSLVNTTFMNLDFDDSSWKVGAPMFGFNSFSTATRNYITPLRRGVWRNPLPSNCTVPDPAVSSTQCWWSFSSYFRRSFTLQNVANLVSGTIFWKVSDATACYLNGSPMWKWNVNTATYPGNYYPLIFPNTGRTVPLVPRSGYGISDYNQPLFQNETLSAAAISLFREGTNLIACSIHPATRFYNTQAAFDLYMHLDFLATPGSRKKE